MGTPLAVASSAPPTSEPADSAPALDATREDAVNAVMGLPAEDFPFDRDCVAMVVSELADDDVLLLAASIAGSELETTDSAMTDDADDAEGDTDSGSDVMATDDVVAPQTDAPGSTASGDASTGTDLAAEARREIVVEVLACLDGDANPALVDEALAIAVVAEGAEGFDADCMAGVLGTLDDATLEYIIANGSLGDDSASGTEPDDESAGADATGDFPLDEEQYSRVLNLLGCAPADFLK